MKSSGYPGFGLLVMSLSYVNQWIISKSSPLQVAGDIKSDHETLQGHEHKVRSIIKGDRQGQVTFFFFSKLQALEDTGPSTCWKWGQVHNRPLMWSCLDTSKQPCKLFQERCWGLAGLSSLRVRSHVEKPITVVTFTYIKAADATVPHCMLLSETFLKPLLKMAYIVRPHVKQTINAVTFTYFKG